MFKIAYMKLRNELVTPVVLLLEPYPKGMYVMYPYLGSHYDRVLVVIRYI
jgi:hypothetical protein